MARYDFLTQGRSYDSIHPSLQHQAEANMGFWLYEVVPGRIYRCAASISPTSSRVTAAGSSSTRSPPGRQPPRRSPWSRRSSATPGAGRGLFAFARRSLRRRGHRRGGRQERQGGRHRAGGLHGPCGVGVVYAGAAMIRRLQYQYGSFLPHSPQGHVDQAIGKTTPVGTVTLIAPTRIIEGRAKSSPSTASGWCSRTRRATKRRPK